MAKRQKKEKTGGCLKTFLPYSMFALAIVFAIYAYFYEDDLAREYLRFERYFKGYFEEYLAVDRENIQERPFRTGKLLWMKPHADSYGVWLDSMFYELPEEMKAVSPEEVSTVLIVDYKKETYVQGVRESSYVWNAYFRIVDWPSRSIIYRGVLEGEPPSGEEQMSTGPRPEWDLLRFIEGLPLERL